MRKFVKWTALIVGTAILLNVGAILVSLAITMQPLGGIPLSRDFVWYNFHWVVASVLGLFLLAVAIVMFVRDSP